MSEKWIVMLTIWVLCTIVSIRKDAPLVMLIPAFGTFLAALPK